MIGSDSNNDDDWWVVSLINNVSAVISYFIFCFEFTTQYTYFSALRYSPCIVAAGNGNGNGWKWEWKWFDGSGKGIWTRKSSPHTSRLHLFPDLVLATCFVSCIALQVYNLFYANKIMCFYRLCIFLCLCLLWRNSHCSVLPVGDGLAHYTGYNYVCPSLLSCLSLTEERKATQYWNPKGGRLLLLKRVICGLVLRSRNSQRQVTPLNC